MRSSRGPNDVTDDLGGERHEPRISEQRFVGGAVCGAMDAVGAQNIGGSFVEVRQLSLPAGTYLVWAAGNVGDAGDDTQETCKLVANGTSALGTAYVDTFAAGTNTTRGGFAPFSLVAPVSLQSAGWVEVDCRAIDSSAGGEANNVSITAVTVDALN